MKIFFQYLFSIVCSILLFLDSTHGQIKVAAVGNGFTYGVGIRNQKLNSYPAQLAYYLGKNYHVENFGSQGLGKYTETEEFNKSLAFNPEIVLIELCPDAEKIKKIDYPKEFEEELIELLKTYKNLKSKPKIVLLTPLFNFLDSDSEKITRDQLIPLLEEIAMKENLDLVNLRQLFSNQWSDHWFPDKTNISSIAAGKIAQKIFYNLSNQKTSGSNVISKFALKPVSEFNFHGYQGYKYLDHGVEYFIVSPKHVAKGNPWIWRARFWGHEPQTDIDLLERGFYVTYCDVSDLYGSQKAVDRWNQFYYLVTQAGLNSRVVLEGMSRGGLIVYNWAAQNPEKVAAIYADAPVMDFKSWPMGKGSSPGSDEDSKRLLESYGFQNEEEAINWNKNPIDHSAILAKTKIPIIHVVGDVDDVVPVIENTEVFEKLMKASGSEIKVIHKPEVSHHPHSLFNPEPIVEFILKATGHSENMCIKAVPGNEFRSGAGWKEGSDWHDVAADIQLTLEKRKIKLLLLGNSITQGFGGNRELVSSKPGKSAMDAAMKGAAWESAGISGDKTQNLLWRLKNQNYNVAEPEYTIITIGINNVTPGDSAEDIAAGIIACAEEAKKKMPNSKIVLFGLLPAGKEKDQSNRLVCNQIHSILSKSKLKGIEYINPTTWFVNSDGSLKTELYSGDFLHLNEAGYKMWSEKIGEIVWK